MIVFSAFRRVVGASRVVGGDLLRKVRRRPKYQAVATSGRDQPEVDHLGPVKADAVVALAGHGMEAVAGLDAYRRRLAQADSQLNAILTDIEAAALTQFKKMQVNLFDGWKT
jgi:hypothetical protein